MNMSYSYAMRICSLFMMDSARAGVKRQKLSPSAYQIAGQGQSIILKASFIVYSRPFLSELLHCPPTTLHTGQVVVV
jgi:hypothetical protein